MNSIRRVYLTKLCLCANPYLPVFFVLLTSNGISRSEVSTAIAIGTMVMFAGDALTSALSDRVGPRRVVAVCGLLQAIAVVLLPMCSTASRLCWIEVLIGLTFPAIHGADSKWLRHLSEGASGERWNHSVTWTSQMLSAVVGGMLLAFPTFACYLSALLYAIGVALTLNLPDIPQRPRFTSKGQMVRAWSLLTKERFLNVVSFALMLGVVNTVPWLLQLHASALYSRHRLVFCLIQVFGAALSILGSAYYMHGSRKRTTVMAICMFAMMYIYIFRQNASPMIWLPIAAGMVLRGSVSVAAREAVLAGIESTGPVATLTMAVNAQSKMVQAVLLTTLSRLV